MTDALLREVADVIGTPNVITDPQLLATHVVDWTGRFHGHTRAVVRPGSTAGIQICFHHILLRLSIH